MTLDQPKRRIEDQAVTWWQRFRHGYHNAFYRNSMIYCMLLLTINVVLNVIPLTRNYCGF